MTTIRSCNPAGTRFLPLAAMITAMIASSAHAQWSETFVEPVFIDCSGAGGVPLPLTNPPGLIQGWKANGWGGGPDLDNDGRVGRNEDTDGDAIYSTLQLAVNNVSGTGGVVHVTVPGVYRERVSISGRKTLRVAKGVEAILDASSYACATSPPLGPFTGEGISVSGTGSVVEIENLTIRGSKYGVAVRPQGPTDVTITFKGGRIEGCELMAFWINGLHQHLTIVDTEIVSNALGVGWYTGASSSEKLHIQNCTFLRNGENFGAGSGNPFLLLIEGSTFTETEGNGLTLISPVRTAIRDSTFSMNGGSGIDMIGGELLTVVDSSFHMNALDGLFLQAAGDSPSVSLADCRISDNLSDGIATATYSQGAVVNLFMWQTAVLTNGGFGINAPAGTVAPFCTFVGHNHIANNGAGGASNQTPNTPCLPGSTDLRLNSISPP